MPIEITDKPINFKRCKAQIGDYIMYKDETHLNRPRKFKITHITRELNGILYIATDHRGYNKYFYSCDFILYKQKTHLPAWF